MQNRRVAPPPTLRPGQPRGLTIGGWHRLPHWGQAGYVPWPRQDCGTRPHAGGPAPPCVLAALPV